ncbi:Integral membrane protein SYS1-related protein [Metarhizium album ARSEF 1941]|uniref:Integral membrane protein SYS1-related protein n=1 Tax=Metarhizium album (strain ARSEF 1941) TaxID=1081103 RepID=A0A0B2X8I3_METAS|nr:Integral membrane protein SYS1-related protein [Metarhizium album ARSEF 1941]KHO02088.1 Integral membrane protein SYS1-related protein [Metarhizium album ARSEF 1941]
MARRRKPPRAGALSELQPLKIATQIAALQALYYITAGVLMLFTALVAGMSFSVDMILGWDAVRGDTTQGWLLSLIWLADGGLCIVPAARAVAMVVLIARSKLVPDFALTMHLLHLVFTALYTRSLPRHSMWWMTMMASAAVAVALGVWGCRYRELQPVFFAGGRILGSNSGSAPAAASNSHVAAEEGRARPEHGDDGDDGFPRGRGRGRGKDGAGEYEMVGIKQAKD